MRLPQQSPLETASWWSYLWWGWLNPLLATGKKRQLNLEDVYRLPDQATSEHLLPIFDAFRKAHPADPLWKTLARMFWRRWVIGGALYVFWAVSAAFQPYIVRRLVDFFEDPDEDVSVGLSYAAAMISTQFIYTMAINHKFHLSTYNGVRIRATLMGKLFQKSLKMSVTATGGAGQLSNLISSDCERVFEAHLLLHYLWASPIFVVVVVGLMIQAIGIAALIGFGVLLLIIPLQASFGRIIGSRKRKMMVQTDIRTNIFSQVLRGIQVVKIYAWEDPFIAQMIKARREEIHHLKKMHYIHAVMRAVVFSFPPVVSLVTLATYVALGNELTLGVTFLTLSFINILRFPMLLIPYAFFLFHEGHVSLGRIQEFLDLPNTPKLKYNGEQQDELEVALSNADRDGSKLQLISNGKHEEVANGNGNSDDSDVQQLVVANEIHLADELEDTFADDSQVLMIKRRSKFYWKGDPEENEEPVFQTLGAGFGVRSKSFVGIVGAVGSGKSSLAHSLLGELHSNQEHPVLFNDEINPNHTSGPLIGYADQSPAIVHGTLRDNILFGMPFDQKRYDKVIYASCLEHDVALMPNGHDTEIGERGINLSGGQKARVSFARVLYHADRCTLFIFDDPFSAVDVDVAHTMFERSILTFLKNKTRIVFVSSHIDLLVEADDVIVLEEGKVKQRGSYEQIFNTMRSSFQRTLEHIPSTVSTSEESNDAADGDKNEDGPETRGLTVEENREAGSVSWSLYFTYFSFASKLPGWAVVLSVILVYSVGQGVRVMSDVWLSWWADEDEEDIPSKLRGRDDLFWQWTLVIWVMSSLVIAIFRSLFCVYLSMGSCETTHNKVLKSLLLAPLRFFQENPTGRVLNRMSADLGRSDVMLVQTLYQFLDNLFILISVFILAFFSLPWLLILMIPFLLILNYVQGLYRSSSRELLRLDGTSRSPMVSLTGQLLNSRSTVRAFGMSELFLKKAEELVDANLAVMLIVKISERWISVIINLMNATFIGVLIVVASFLRDSVDPTLIGLALTYSMQLMGMASWTIKMFVDLENNFTAFERLCEFLNIEQEGEARPKDGQLTFTPQELPDGWPSKGQITLKNVVLRYREDLPPALDGLSMDIQAGEKIGICGRTGAGKSSVMLAMFRLFESSEGSEIIIDDIDISTLNVQQVRSRIAFIPQEPILFAGSVRYNLDPFGSVSDAKLWEVLEKVQLKEYVSKLPDRLDQVIHDGTGGGSLSHGQRQLLCIGRALAKENCRILFCDEATSCVDPKTDTIIQEILRTEFADCTVLTIAHRINTIIHSDRIIVLDSGKLIEFDSPSNLLSDPSSVFSQLARGQQDDGSEDGGDDGIEIEHVAQSEPEVIVSDGSVVTEV